MELLTRYIDKLKFKGCSECTVHTYTVNLDQFRTYIKDNFMLDAMELDDIKQVAGYMVEQWQLDLRNRKLSPSSEQLKVAVVRAYFTWLTKAQFIDRNPADILVNVKVTQEEHPHLSWSEVERVMELYHSRNTLRDYCIMSIAFTMGIRVSGIADLNIGDINGNTMTYTNKGGARKTAFIPDPVVDVLCQYIAARRAKADESEPLFVSERNDRIDTATIRNIFKKASDLIGTKITPHGARRTCLSRINELQGLEMAQSIAAHTSDRVTKRYLYESAEHMRELYKDMPLFNPNNTTEE